MAIIYSKVNKYELALTNYNEALRIKRESIPDDLRNIAITLNNMANIYYIEKKFDALQEFINENRLHYTVRCNECTGFIVGYRYQCSKCDNYNVCEPCIEDGTVKHKHRQLNKIERSPVKFE